MPGTGTPGPEPLPWYPVNVASPLEKSGKVREFDVVCKVVTL